jgi:hypothetical protein
MPKVTKFHFNQSQSENRQKYKVQSVMSFPHVLRRSKAHGEHLPRYKSQQEEGAKGPKGNSSWKKIKSKRTKPSDALPRDP